MGFWTLKYRDLPEAEFKVVEVSGVAGIPPFFDQITTDQFIAVEMFATHSDEDTVTFYKPFTTKDWQRLENDQIT